MKKHLLIIATIVVLLLGLMTVIACNGLPAQVPGGNSSPSDGLDYKTLYAYAQDLGFEGSLEDLINACKGDNAYEIACKNFNYKGTVEEWLQSLVGAAGKDGETPTIGDNGNWWIGDIDTGVKAEGKDGIDGQDGVGIESISLSDDGCLSIVLTDGNKIELGNIRGEVGAAGQNGLDGINGKSAYEIAKDNGYEGSEEEWLQTLVGATGAAGSDGQNGQDGKDGVTPSIGSNGNWWIGDIDTGVKAEGTGYQYLKLDDGDYYIAVGSFSRLSVLDIPSSYNKHDVVGIEEEGFLSSKALKEVSIPSSIEWIGKDAFPSTLTKVNYDGSCKDWTDIDIEKPNDALLNAEIVFKTPHSYVDGVCTICGKSDEPSLNHDILIIEKQDADYVVTGVKNTTFTEITIPSFITKINKNVFADCTNLTAVHITDLAGWLNIDFEYEIQGSIAASPYSNPLYRACDNKATNALFLNGETLTGEITIPEGVTSIPYSAFPYCTEITSIVIPDSVTKIDTGAFGFCTGLTSINIPDNVTSIGSMAFVGCAGLSNITISNNVTSINLCTFYGCTGLTSVTIGSSVTSIGEQAFYNCSSLSDITIHDSITSIGYQAFYGCSRLKTVVIDSSTIASLSSSDSGLLESASTVYVKEGLEAGSYITDSFTLAESSDMDGYVKYVK